MNSPFCTLTEDDFASANIDAVTAGCEYQECRCFFNAFFERAHRAKEADDLKAEAVFGLLQGVTSMCLSLEDRSQPFKPMLVLQSGRSLIPADFDDDMLGALERAATRTSNPELLARIGDLLWTCRHKYQWAERAIRAYLDADPQQVTPQSPYAAHRLLRALDLATMLNKPELRDEAHRRIDNVLDDMIAGPDARLSLVPEVFLNALLVRRLGSPGRYAALARQMAELAEAKERRDLARTYWHLAAQGFALAGDALDARAVRVKAAESYAVDAHNAAKGHNTPHLIAAHWLECAINEYRKIGGIQTRIDELHSELIEHQQAAVRLEMKPMTFSSPVADELLKAQQSALDKVKGKSLAEALLQLAFICHPVNKQQMRQAAETELNDFVLVRLFERRVVNEMGKTVALLKPVRDGDQADEDDFTRIMHQHAGTARSFTAQVIIEPLRYQIGSERFAQPDDLLPLLRGNPYIPEGREAFFARGICAGLYGDLALATHLLVPQVENMMRHLLAMKGVIPSGLTDEGVQNEFDVNRTLREAPYKAALESVLGEDMVFDLQGLLVSRFGANLRNEVAHGLLSYQSFNSNVCSYSWWLTLRLCLLPILLFNQTGRGEAVEQPLEGTEGTSSAPDQDDASVDDDCED